MINIYDLSAIVSPLARLKAAFGHDVSFEMRGPELIALFPANATGQRIELNLGANPDSIVNELQQTYSRPLPVLV